MMGSGAALDESVDPEDHGLIPRICSRIFEQVDQVNICKFCGRKPAVLDRSERFFDRTCRLCARIRPATLRQPALLDRYLSFDLKLHIYAMLFMAMR